MHANVGRLTHLHLLGFKLLLQLLQLSLDALPVRV